VDNAILETFQKVGEFAAAIQTINEIEPDKLDSILAAMNDRDPRLLSKKEAAKYLGISTQLLDAMAGGRVKTKAPKSMKIAGRILYDIKDLDKWIDTSPKRN